MTTRPTLKMESRVATGRQANRKLRSTTGLIPAVLYGRGEESVVATLVEDEFRRLLDAGNRTANVDLEGKEVGVIFREVQYDTYGEKILHVDLQRIQPGQRIQVNVPLLYVGETDAPGVIAGGRLAKLKLSVDIKVSVDNIPFNIRCDVSKLDVSQALQYGELPIPEDSELVSPPNVNVATIQAPKRKGKKLTKDEKKAAKKK